MTFQRRAEGSFKLVRRLFLASALLVPLQLALGANPLVVLLALFTGLVCLAPVYWYGPSRTVGVLFIIIWYVFSFGELLTKTVLLQPVDSYLFNPLLTHFIMLAGACAMSLAALGALMLTPLKGNALKPVLDPNRLIVLGFIFVGLWAASRILFRFGGDIRSIAVFLTNYVNAAFICFTSAAIIQSEGRRTFSLFSVVVALITGLDSIAGNSKQGIMLIGFSYLLCLFAFGRRPSWRALGVFAAVIALVSVSLYPAIHIARNDRGRLSPLQIAVETLDTSVGLLVRDPAAVDEAAGLDRQEDSIAYNLYQTRYLGRASNWFDRFIATGYVDAITRGVSFDGPFYGLDYVLRQSTTWLPRQFNADKETQTRLSSGDQVVRVARLSDNELDSASTVPIPAELFVAGGFLAILLVGAPVLFLPLFAMNIMAFNFNRNIWSIYFIVIYGYMFSIGGYVVYLYMFLRQFPADFVIISGAGLVAGLVAGRVSRLADRTWGRRLAGFGLAARTSPSKP